MTIEILSGIPDILKGFGVAGAAAGGAFGVIKWFSDFVATRMDKREDRLDRDTRYIIDNLRGEVDRMQKRMNSAEDHITAIRKELSDCHVKHTKAEAENVKLRAFIESQFGVRNVE